jgi:MOSC domain-containing protein YiiM
MHQPLSVALEPALFASPRPHVAQINVGPGGVPKIPIGRVLVDERGIIGDAHRNKKIHGGPDQALCLWALEIIQSLRAEGHPVEAGATGENITTLGFDWTRLRPGLRLRLGTVLAEFTDWAAPCTTIAHAFSGARFKRASDKVYPGWSRAYAAVIEGGVISVQDAIEIVP